MRAEEVTGVRIYRRFAVAVGSLLALILAGGAAWKL
jgi:hypothetical protein